MPRRIPCPNCGVSLSVPEAGIRSGTCPSCGHNVSVPGMEPPPVPDLDSGLPTIEVTRKKANVRTRRRSNSSQLTLSNSVFDLLDFRFKKYLTPWIIRLTWILVLAWATICVLVILFGFVVSWLPSIQDATPSRPSQSSPFEDSPDEPSVEFDPSPITEWFSQRLSASIGLVTLLFGIVLSVLWARVVLELAIVLFNIATTLGSINDKAESFERREL